MGIFQIIQIIGFLIINGPKIYKGIREIIDMIDKQKDKARRKFWRRRLTAAISGYDNHRDPEKLGHEIKQMKLDIEREAVRLSQE